MSMNQHEQPSDGVDHIIDRLEAERRVPAPEQLQRVRARARATERRRLSFVSVIVVTLGIVLTSGGAGLAISGLSSSGQTAVQAQYPLAESLSEQPSLTPEEEVAGDEDSSGEEPGLTDDSGAPSIGAAPSDGGGSSGPATTQAPRQVAASGSGDLPFTGYLTGVILMAGIALLVTGVLLRRRTRDLTPA